MLSIEGLRRTFCAAAGDVTALEGVDLQVNDGEFVCVVGPSGCGKTTLLKVLAGLESADSGEISTSATLGFVFQQPGLFPWMPVIDNVGFGVADRSLGTAARRAHAAPLLEAMGLSAFAEHLPHQLSGGMQQRVNLARALVARPQTLLMDEPFAALDAQTRHVMREELLRLWNDHSIDVLFVTHDIEEAILLGDRVLVMSSSPGRIIDDITIELARPRDLTGRAHPELGELRWHIWQRIRNSQEAAT